MGRLPVRERIDHLLDKGSPFFEIGLWAAYKMYEQWGNVPAAGVVAGIGNIAGVACMIIANDATVKAGAFFPQTAKKLIRAQRIAFECALPIIYLVDSAGVFLPMQDEIFPDEDDFGRIFRNNSVISAAGFPVRRDHGKLRSRRRLSAGPLRQGSHDRRQRALSRRASLVKAAIGQIVDAEELGGAHMHAEISGTVDFYEKDDPSCLKRLAFAGRPSAGSQTGKDAKSQRKRPRPAKILMRFTI